MPNPWPAGCYSLEQVFGVSSDRIWPAIEREGAAWWSGLPATDEAEQLLETMRSLGVPISFATSPRSPLEMRHHEVAGSTSLICERFGAAPRIVDGKSELARPRWLLVDDSDHEVQAWRAAGGRAITVPRPWNSEHSHSGDPQRVVERIRQQLQQLGRPEGGCLVVDLPLPPATLRPNSRSTVHGFVRAKVADYRQACHAIVAATLRRYRCQPPRWERFRIEPEWRTESGRAWDWTNAVAALKPAEDALQRAGVIRNDSATVWERPTWIRAESLPKCGVRVTVVSGG